jgi:hypothetical protein
MAYEVQTYTLCDGWINTWSVEEDGISYPETFASRKEAEAALDVMADIQAEIDAGERAPDEGYSCEEFAIVEIPDKAPALR